MGIVSLTAKIRIDGMNESRRGLQSLQVEFRKTADTGQKAAGGANAFAAALSALGRVAGGAASNIGRVTGVLGVSGVGLGFVSFQTAARMDSLARALATAAGGSGDLESQLTRLREVAKLPGLSFEQAVQGSVNLQAAGLSASLAERSLTAFGNALASAGKGAAELEGVVTALSQIVSKGTVSAEEINQIAERVPQIRRLLKDAFGTADTQQIQKLGLSAEDAIERIVSAAEKLPKAVGGIGNLLENIADRFQKSIIPLGKGIGSIFERISPSIERFLDKTERLFERIGGILERFGNTGVLNQVIENLANLLDSRKIDEFFASFLAGATVIANNLPALIGVVSESIGGLFDTMGEGIKRLRDDGKQTTKPGYIGAGMAFLDGELVPGEAISMADGTASGKGKAKASGPSLNEIFAKMAAEFTSLRDQLLGVAPIAAAAKSAFLSQTDIDRLVQAQFDWETYPGDRAMAASKPLSAYADRFGRLSDGSSLPNFGGFNNWGMNPIVDRQLADLERNARQSADALSLRAQSLGGGELAAVGVTPVELGNGGRYAAPLIPSNTLLERAVRELVRQELGPRIGRDIPRIGG